MKIMTKKQVLFCLLYFVFYEFTKENYNGIMRQLLKLFIRDMKPFINKILNQDVQTNVGYLLAIFEKHVADHSIERERFDLLAMRNILIPPEEIERLHMTTTMEECNICEINKVKLKDSPKPAEQKPEN